MLRRFAGGVILLSYCKYMKYYLKLPVFHVYKLIKIGNQAVLKNINQTLYDFKRMKLI